MKTLSNILSRALIVLLAGGIASAAVAQQTESRIVGRVVDQSGAVLPGVTVTVTSAQTGAVRSVVSDAEGTYAVTNLSRGLYEIAFELSGFNLRIRQVTLGVGSTETVDTQLTIAGVSEDVTVRGESPVLDLSSARTGVNVSPVEVESLPVNGRNFANLMTLATGATTDGNGGWSSIRFNGKSNQQNYLSYDGVDGTYVWDASPGYLNVTGSQFRLQTSMESVAEFRVSSGLAPAESGLGTGGNITVVTKSGGNRFNGALFEFKRDDAIDSASTFDDTKQELRLDQFGGSLGGPLVRGRTFFFASYEGLRQKTGLSFTEATPSDYARGLILAGQPIGAGGGQSAARTRAVAPLLNGFPLGQVASTDPLAAITTLSSLADQREDTLSFRLDHRFSDTQSFYVRYLLSDGTIDTPDATATARRVDAWQTPQNVAATFQSIFGTNRVNELKVGFNRPNTSALAYGPAGYPADQVTLSGAVTSGSIDARGSTGIARAGLQLRATSAASGRGSTFEPVSLSLSDAFTWTRGAHTLKFGGEYRQIAVDFQFLGGDNYEFNSIRDFIDNRPNRVQRTADSPVFTAEQRYVIGYVQNSWRPTGNLSLELGLRYEYYSVVKEKNGRAKPFFVDDLTFAADPDDFYNPDVNNVGPRVSATWMPFGPKTVLRGGIGLYYGPGQFEDRIQPIENAIERYSVSAGDVPDNGLQYPVSDAVFKSALSVRGYTRERPDEHNLQYGLSVQRELPGEINLSVGYTGSRGRDLFLRGVANTYDVATQLRPRPEVGQVDFKTSGGTSTFDALQISATRRFRGGLTGGFQYMLASSTGTTQGSNEASTAQNTFDFSTEQGRNSTDVRHTVNGSLVYLFPGQGALTGGWRVGGILNGRSGVPFTVTIARPDFVTVNGVRVMNIPGGNSRGTQRPDLVPGVDPYLRDGARWLNPAAFAAPAAGAFGNMARNALEGPAFWQADLVVSKDFRFGSRHSLQVRLDVFNLTNRLNYAQPAVVLPAGTPGETFTAASAGATFGQLLSPLNRTVGLGTARQGQISIRYAF